MINRDIFREYDVRGRVEEDLTDDVVADIGRGVAAYLLERGQTRAAIARDCRLSSEHFRDLLVDAMMESGLCVTDLGTVPTPLFYFSLFNLEVDGGIMVTGSHNPPQFNGFKIASGKSTMFGPEIQNLGDIIEKRQFAHGKGSYTEYPHIIEDYYRFLRGNIRLPKKLRVVIDAGNGTAGVVAQPIMEEMGVDVLPLFCDMDGHFPNHFPDPTIEKNLEPMRNMVLTNNADVGIGFDGDGDRIGVVDERGNVIWGDYLMIIFAREILKQHAGAAFVSEVKCSENLYEDIRQRGGRPVMWRTGHSLIKKKMKEVGAMLAGEMSGHMFFADRFFGYDDAIYAALRLLEILGRETRPFSALLSDLPTKYSTPEIRIDCPERVKFQVVNELTEQYRKQFDVIDIDGVRVKLPGGWGLVRASNTQPILVLRFEADTSEALRRIEAMVMEDLERIMKRHQT
jgi:phosphomannomutase / phosphoglucomutase